MDAVQSDFLVKVKQKRAKALSQINTIVAAKQNTCKHKRIAHWDGFSTYGTYHPHRICLDCGVEEEGGWWCYSIDCPHWHIKEGVTTVLGTTAERTFTKVSFDDLTKLRP